MLFRSSQAKILVTHDTLFAAALVTRAVFFEKGRITAEGTVPEIVERFAWSPVHGATPGE